MTAPTARDRHAEHTRTGQPCNCAGAQPVPTAREIVETAWGPDEHWPDVPVHRLRRIAQAVDAEFKRREAAVWRAAAELVEAMTEPQSTTMDTGNLWRRTMAGQIAAALRARGEAGG